MADTKKSLVGKLADACDAVGGIEKKGVNESQKYKYIKAADVAKAIRHELFQRGVILLADEKAFQQTGEIETKFGSKLREFTLTVEYTLHDSESDQKLSTTAYGVAMDSGDKAIYKAKTGALKYYLRGLGLIPDEKDDPEADESIDIDSKIDRAEANVAPKLEGQQIIAPFQVTELEKRWKASGWTAIQVATYLSDLNNYVQLEEIQKQHFNDVIKTFSKPPAVPQDLVPALQRSVEVANESKGLCEACGNKVVPGGVSKKTHQSYASFCSNPKCPTRQKPQRLKTPEHVDATDNVDVPF